MMWETSKLGDICGFQGGTQPPKSVFISEPEDGYIRLLQIRDFKSDDKAVYIPVTKKNRRCQANDIMIGRYGASVGQIHRGKAGAYNVALIKTMPNLEILDHEFFYHYLVSDLFQKPLVNVSARSAQAGFSKDDIFNFAVPLPPLEEQQRIVGILDEAFAGIDQAIANIEKNLQNARELFESYLINIFTQKGEEWVVGVLGDFCKKVEYGTSTKSSQLGKVPVLRMGNIQNRKFIWDKLVYTDDQDEISKYLLKNGDVLFNRTNSPELVGKSAIYTGERPAIFAGYLIKIHRKENEIDAEFLNFFLNSSIARKHGKTVMSGSVNQANINGTKLKNYPISLPRDLDAQRKIVSQLNQLSEGVENFETVCQQKLTALKELKQSLLQKAFAGELTSDMRQVA